MFCEDEGFKLQRGKSGRCDNVQVAELQETFKKLKAGKTCAEDGLLAEMLKTEHVGLLNVIADMFTDLLRGDQDIPGAWCSSKLVVLFKKGDVELPQNYRPMAIVAVLGKLFSGVLLCRIKSRLNELQPPEQAGFRPDYSCSDIVKFLRLIAEKAEEGGEEVWMASLDLEKAFDKVLLTSILDCLVDASVEEDVVHTLWAWYRQLTAYVHVDPQTVSRFFRVARGVRQGDPLSSILFNNGTRKIFQELKQKSADIHSSQLGLYILAALQSIWPINR